MSDALNAEDLTRLVGRAGNGPVVMVNLLALRSDGGAEGYAAYGEAVAPLLVKAGGEVIYAGRGAELVIGVDHDRWDLVVIVRYPTRQAFLDMVGSPEYQAIQHLRDESLTRSVLLATDPAPIL